MSERRDSAFLRHIRDLLESRGYDMDIADAIGLDTIASVVVRLTLAMLAEAERTGGPVTFEYRYDLPSLGQVAFAKPGTSNPKE